MAAQAEVRFDENSVKAFGAFPPETPQNDLVVEHLPLVKAIAVQVSRKLPEHVDLDDLIQAGTIGLLDAMKKFDSRDKVAFGAYAKHRIRGAILDSLRQQDWASRDTRRRHRRVEEVTRELSGELQRAPMESEIADRMGMDLDDWRQMMIDLRIEFVSAASNSRDPEESAPMEFPDKVENRPDTLCARNQLSEMLEGAMQTLSEREREMLRLYYHNETSMTEISEIFGVHQSRTSQIHKAAVQKIAKVFRSAGIHSSQTC
jgi:RNA polymerase sigma factor for flagellar operon FliA